jgi:hypothetical protein
VDQIQNALAIPMGRARVNVSYGGQNAELPETVSLDATPEQIKAWVGEALRGGDIPGIPADRNASVEDFVVDKYEPNEQRPYPLFMVRPKVPFGA